MPRLTLLRDLASLLLLSALLRDPILPTGDKSRPKRHQGAYGTSRMITSLYSAGTPEPADAGKETLQAGATASLRYPSGAPALENGHLHIAHHDEAGHHLGLVRVCFCGASGWVNFQLPAAEAQVAIATDITTTTRRTTLPTLEFVSFNH